jgi:serine protease Do
MLSTTRYRIAQLTRITWLTLCCLAPLAAQESADSAARDPLEEFNRSLQQVVAKVSPAIVQIEAVGYNRKGDEEKSDNRLLAKTECEGSGVIVGADGYVITNAHVVEGARRIRVILDDRARASQRRNSTSAFDASVVGIFAEADLALLKVSANGLPTIRMAPSDSVRAGQMVFAIGSPEGLQNSVSMGVISAVARQDQPDRPLAYIQTDAAIHAGSSGGALVDIHGNLVGITTFIITEGGGNEGLGFAVPGELVYMIYEELKTRGRVRVGDIGIKVQEISSVLAAGLHLNRESGLIVSDVLPGSTAERAGIHVQDIVLSLDGNLVRSLPQFATSFYTRHAGDHVSLELLRGQRPVSVTVEVIDNNSDVVDPLDSLDFKNNVIPRLGIACVSLSPHLSVAGSIVRSESGILVAAKLAHADVRTGLAVGDLIRSLNATNVGTVEEFRARIDNVKSGEPVVLQVERHGRLKFVSFELD